jgi:hypothetical protein
MAQWDTIPEDMKTKILKIHQRRIAIPKATSKETVEPGKRWTGDIDLDSIE